MKEQQAEYAKKINGKKVAVIGIGVSNTPLIDFLLSCGANVMACDRKASGSLGAVEDALRKKGVELHLGDTYLDNLDADVIFKTPGMRPDVPQLVKARERGAQITSEMEVFFDLCPCKIIAVTGSDGKTTTTTLIERILTEAGYRCHLGGNIGTPLIGKLEEIQKEDIAVLELSSFQLFTISRSPEIAVITNLAPNHLDWHIDMDEYVSAKKHIFAYQGSDDTIVLNYDNEITRNMMKEKKGKGIYFSRQGACEEGVLLLGDEIVMKLGGETTKIMKAQDIRLPGVHNIENYMAAIGAVWDMVKPEHIRSVAREFSGVEHRIEFVRQLHGVRYYNDSIASSPTRTAAALNSFSQKVILIAGGYDKKIPFDDLGKLIAEKVKHLVLVGHTSDKIEAACKAAGAAMPIDRCQDFRRAVECAKNAAQPGDVVLLSPACASFDLFSNFMQRGNVFKEYVNELK